MEITLFLQTTKWTPQINPADKMLRYLTLKQVVHVAATAHCKANGSRRFIIVSTDATIFPPGPIKSRKNRVYSFRPCLSFTVHTRVFYHPRSCVALHRFLQILRTKFCLQMRDTCPTHLAFTGFLHRKILWRIKIMACIFVKFSSICYFLPGASS
jgi:hypothetical protein